ncbi:MAG: HTH-type transcriptional repressor YcgE [Deltaproteobacteria bacterium ADurb.Bin151]|jgi:DNA-binding transcriptional MerR regulator|nr:MerR family transcriptional regulator [Smithella sp.]OQB51091.1 MAG: HTH-type transcriptional repressor YcgE [Deltaproteobacteria bacterium ADurb.Bin151]HNZ11720.1 MerR family transcriptional regulator [Smithellaceae bacterium]HOG82637.1 MerR family transcriptional regulator [Smithellaceae bacterium]HOQ42376.1 MerR family transcriptional regulator [Smithellaceae bacterium]
MDSIIPEKAYFRIGEVSKILNVEPYVIRYWESEFKTIKPVRTKTSQRLYRKKDVQELLTIRNLLYQQRFTINGAKQQLMKMRDREESADTENEKLIYIKKELEQIRKIMS